MFTQCATLTAWMLVQARAVNDIINGPIREVFLRHAAHLTHSLYLQHRHHTVGAGEAVVKVEGTAHLMDCGAVKDIVSFGNDVVPTTWMASNDKLLPMEFAVVTAAYVILNWRFLGLHVWLMTPTPGPLRRCPRLSSLRTLYPFLPRTDARAYSVSTPSLRAIGPR